MKKSKNETERLSQMRSYYDSTYYRSAKIRDTTPRHLQKLALKIGIQKNQQILDVACGTGEWLMACNQLGAAPNGIDLSVKAIAVCKATFRMGKFYSTPAESLPFEDNQFDVVTCLGALEHFVDPKKAL
jgi:ubiquinone/menaquinone biosynthesis C-methylase UbiE